MKVEKKTCSKCGNYAWRGHICVYLEYARGTMMTGIEASSFQKTGGFERRSEATLLVSLTDFLDKIYRKQKA